MVNGPYTLELKEVTKIFSRRTIFEKLSVHYTHNGIYGIAGANGMGKSTLVKTIANIITPTSGTIQHRYGENIIVDEKLHNTIGFLSPYFVFYEEFSALENIELFLSIRGISAENERISELFDRLALSKRKKDLVKTFSSGMKQRLKLIFALSHKPDLLILDEPTSNLDDAGKEQFYSLISDYADKAVILIASNEKNDLALCSSCIKLEEYKNV